MFRHSGCSSAVRSVEAHPMARSPDGWDGGSRMRRFLAIGVLVLVGSVGNAQATTITFEDLAIDDGAVTGGDRTSGGFFFDSATNHSHIVEAATSWGTGNGTHFMLI